LSDFNEIFSDKFAKDTQISDFMKILLVGERVVPRGQTELIVTFRNLANAPKMMGVYLFIAGLGSQILKDTAPWSWIVSVRKNVRVVKNTVIAVFVKSFDQGLLGDEGVVQIGYACSFLKSKISL
jgi:hypothetical protein